MNVERVLTAFGGRFGKMTKYIVLGKAKVYPEEVVDPEDTPLKIGFNCPLCGAFITALWLYPSAYMVFTTDCCDATVFFEGRGLE